MRSSFSGVASVVAGASALAAAAHAPAASAFAVGTSCSKEAFSACFVSSNSCISVSYVFRLFVIAMRARLMPHARLSPLRQFRRAHARPMYADPKHAAAAPKRSRCIRFHRKHSRCTFQRRARTFAILPSFSHVFTVFCYILRAITADEHANRHRQMQRGTPAQYQKRSCNLCFLRPPDGPPRAHTQPARMP